MATFETASGQNLSPGWGLSSSQKTMGSGSFLLFRIIRKRHGDSIPEKKLLAISTSNPPHINRIGKIASFSTRPIIEASKIIILYGRNFRQQETLGKCP